ncbi:XRE family transcriptional regulator [Desulfosporosinus fructosivorans]|uniref:XRE family transcriptional regulator n=1 Tax=Desulfosporosinus fructosivorans TaxID=2018669 RepID=A0A4Z0RBR8_9FIRM|nr:helix-turn-helix transcriptional regulator [Desulfosporosinus fructosivorans]TGE39607.1 XRE family transcriptional regulator [Desulfosporosinus fructosivorans]
MEKISLNKLSELVIKKRKEKNMSQQDLQDQTSINRMLISRIERRDFVPSIAQLEVLSKTLNFSIQELIEEDKTQNVFVAMRGQAKTPKEEEGIEKLFSMMLTLKKQKVLRSRLYEEQ